MMTAWIHTN